MYPSHPRTEIASRQASPKVAGHAARCTNETDIRGQACGERGDGLTDEIRHEEEHILRIGLGGGEVHRGFCVHDLDG